MFNIEREGGTCEGVFVMGSNSLCRSETSMNWFRAIWEAVRAILTIVRVFLFRGDEGKLWNCFDELFRKKETRPTSVTVERYRQDKFSFLLFVDVGISSTWNYCGRIGLSAPEQGSSHNINLLGPRPIRPRRDSFGGKFSSFGTRFL